MRIADAVGALPGSPTILCHFYATAPRVHSLPTPSSASVCWKTALELLEPALLETTESRR